MFQLRAETPADPPAIEELLDRAFGSNRRAKASYAFRRDVEPVRELAVVATATADGRLVGTLRYWPVAVGDARALLLGPLGVEPGLRGRGIGRALLTAGREAVGALPDRPPVLLVGDAGYYGPLGFAPAAPGTVMPGEDPARLMVDTRTAPPPAGRLRPWRGDMAQRAAPAAALDGARPLSSCPAHGRGS
jgi:predicted N-acetyltransferase YhbS